MELQYLPMGLLRYSGPGKGSKKEKRGKNDEQSSRAFEQCPLVVHLYPKAASISWSF